MTQRLQADQSLRSWTHPLVEDGLLQTAELACRLDDLGHFQSQ